ncbi:MAG: hypothetical protein ACOYJB_05115 [Christensenellaceae bacterium]
MKKIALGIALVLLVGFVFAGCAGNAPMPKSADAQVESAEVSQSPQNAEATPEGTGELPQSTPDVPREDASVQLIRSMMELDYAAMTVAEFNETIQQMCENEGTSVFEVISDAYDHFAVYDESGEFSGTKYSDIGLETFMQTTLDYSAQEIFGEPVHLDSVMYMTLPGKTAMETYRLMVQMQSAEWDSFYNENIADLTIYPILSYAVERNIPDPQTTLVAERDSRINNVRDSIRTFLLEMDEQAAMADNLQHVLEAKLQTISDEYSDSDISVLCTIQGLERDIA